MSQYSRIINESSVQALNLPKFPMSKSKAIMREKSGFNCFNTNYEVTVYLFNSSKNKHFKQINLISLSKVWEI